MDWELRDAVSCPPKESDDKRCFQMRWEGVTCGTWGVVEIIILYHCLPLPRSCLLFLSGSRNLQLQTISTASTDLNLSSGG